METKKRIKEVIVVEGHSDTSKLKSLVECDTLETGGSSLDEKTLQLIEKAHQKRGVIVFTDPDYPGMQIRQKISARIGDCKHAFVDKKEAIAHGKVGIAEAKPEAILEALNNAASFEMNRQSLSWSEFISLDIIGDSKRRLYLYDYFKLGFGNAKTLFKRLNMMGATLSMIQEALKEGKE